jgi:hypothetical protein
VPIADSQVQCHHVSLAGNVGCGIHCCHSRYTNPQKDKLSYTWQILYTRVRLGTYKTSRLFADRNRQGNGFWMIAIRPSEHQGGTSVPTAWWPGSMPIQTTKQIFTNQCAGYCVQADGTQEQGIGKPPTLELDIAIRQTGTPRQTIGSDCLAKRNMMGIKFTRHCIKRLQIRKDR